MKFIGVNKTLDSTSSETVGTRIFEFNTKLVDYMYKFHPVWDRVESEYIISVNNRRYTLPSGVYILIGTLAGDTDWVLVDEVFNSEVEVLQMSVDFTNVSLYPAKLVGVKKQQVFMPQTKNPIPIADVSGKRSIVIAYKDMYFKLKHLEIQDYCAI